MVFVGLVTNEELYARTVRMSTLKYTSAKINKDYHILLLSRCKIREHPARCTSVQFDGTML